MEDAMLKSIFAAIIAAFCVVMPVKASTIACVTGVTANLPNGLPINCADHVLLANGQFFRLDIGDVQATGDFAIPIDMELAPLAFGLTYRLTTTFILTGLSSLMDAAYYGPFNDLAAYDGPTVSNMTITTNIDMVTAGNYLYVPSGRVGAGGTFSSTTTVEVVGTPTGNATPEPESLLLVGIALVVLAAVARRRQSSAT